MDGSNPTPQDQEQDLTAAAASSKASISYEVFAREHTGKVQFGCKVGPHMVAGSDYIGLSTKPPRSGVGPRNDQWVDTFDAKDQSEKLSKRTWGSGYYVSYVRKDHHGRDESWKIVVTAGPTT